MSILKHPVIKSMGSFRSALFALTVTLGLSVPVRAEVPQITLHRDIVFETIDGVELKLDLAIPQGPGPFPLILCIHGGAWHVGDKSKLTPMIENLARHDYVAASINYRLAPKVSFPAPLDDTKAALLFLKQRAGQYKIDATKVGGTGESAGAHMAMLMAFEEAQSESRKNPTALAATELQAIVNYYGPVDLVHWNVTPMVDFLWRNHFHEGMETTMLRFLGSPQKDSPIVRAASPINYICKNCPPVLTFHGTLDPVVSFQQAESLHAALRKAGVPEQLVPIANGLHGGWSKEVKRKADEQAVAFFDKYLKGKTATELETHAATNVLDLNASKQSSVR